MPGGMKLLPVTPPNIDTMLCKNPFNTLCRGYPHVCCSSLDVRYPPKAPLLMWDCLEVK